MNHLNQKWIVSLKVLTVAVFSFAPAAVSLAQSEPMTIDEIAPAPPEVGAGIPSVNTAQRALSSTVR